MEDYLQLEESLLAQLIDGELIMSPAPSTNHQRVSRKLLLILKKQLTGELFYSPIDLYLNERNVLQLDLIFVSDEKYRIITEQGIEGVPDLIIEIISPSNSFYGRNTKRRKYLEIGVTEYWIVDPANMTLENYTPKDRDALWLYLAKEGQVSSLVSNSVNFDLKEIF